MANEFNLSKKTLLKEDASPVSPENRCNSLYPALFCTTLISISIIEALLLNIKYDYFRGGFLASNVLEGSGSRILFMLSSLIIDTSLIFFLWTIFLPLASRVLKLSNSRTFIFLALISVIVPFTCDYTHYELQAYMSDMIDISLIWQLAGNSPRELIAQWGSHLTYSAVAVIIAMIILAMAIMVWRRNEIPGIGLYALQSPPRMRTLAYGTVSSALAGSIILSAVAITDSPVRFGLINKPSGMALVPIIEFISDLDRDGYGFMSKPRDPAPFSAKIYPYATDTPGNGIDENGVGGDHPHTFKGIMHAPDEAHPLVRTPNILLILLESFRGDTVEKYVNGREITPFIRKLASEGSQSKLAFAHCGSTAPSRAQLFGGRMSPYPGQSTLIDDFKRNGYYVAYFSGQDDSFGDSGPLVGYERADIFYDARSDKDKRYTQFSTPASLAVSCRLLNHRILSFLNQHELKRPLFLYVNYHDTHFPYHHRELDNILGIDPLPRSKIRPGATNAIWETYANAAANIDRAIAELFNAMKNKLQGDPLIVIITADHGESLFEKGFLGHGYSLEDEQTRVPFILWGDAGIWYEPLGPSDIREQLLRNLIGPESGKGARPRIVPDPSRRVLQYVGSIRTPRVLAWRTMQALERYDFWSDVTTIRRSGLSSAQEKNQAGLASNLIPLIWDWEAIIAGTIQSKDNESELHEPG